MDSNYKLHIKLGSSEFEGEGPEDAVKEAYQQFLEAFAAYKGVGENQPEKPPEQQPQRPEGVAADLLQKAFIREGDSVSLRHLPPADRASRNADAAILVLYGYKKLAAQEDVLVTKLNDSLRTSGISVDRLDRFMAVHASLYRKGGQRSGGRYSLNNQGELQAEQWLKEWYS